MIIVCNDPNDTTSLSLSLMIMMRWYTRPDSLHLYNGTKYPPGWWPEHYNPRPQNISKITRGGHVTSCYRRLISNCLVIAAAEYIHVHHHEWNGIIRVNIWNFAVRLFVLCVSSLSPNSIACHLLPLMSLFCYCAALKAAAQSEMCIDSAGGDEKYKIFLKRIKYFSSVA